MSNSTSPKAVFALIDNSATSINGDFFPNRLEGQKVALERLATYLFSLNPQTQVAALTMSDFEFGIRSSFTSSVQKLQSIMKNVSNGGQIKLEKSLRTAFLSLRHCSDMVAEKHILIFISSAHDLVSLETVKCFNLLAQDRGISIDIVAFGPFVNDKDKLRKLNSNLSNSEFLEIVTTKNLLSDIVLASKIGTGNVRPQIQIDKNLMRTNPDLYEATIASLMQYKKQLNGVHPDKAIEMQLQNFVLEFEKINSGTIPSTITSSSTSSSITSPTTALTSSSLSELATSELPTSEITSELKSELKSPELASAAAAVKTATRGVKEDKKRQKGGKAKRTKKEKK